jgi:hypothetical protein
MLILALQSLSQSLVLQDFILRKAVTLYTLNVHVIEDSDS